MCAVPCAALGPIRTLFEESSRCAGVLLMSGQNLLLRYTQHITTSTIKCRYVWALNAKAKWDSHTAHKQGEPWTRAREPFMGVQPQL